MFTDFWQRALTYVGIAGPDQGQGGLFLLLPPNYDGPLPVGGYHTFRSPTYNVFLFWRAMLTQGADGPDPSEAVELIEKTLVYPLRAGIPQDGIPGCFGAAGADDVPAGCELLRPAGQVRRLRTRRLDRPVPGRHDGLHRYREGRGLQADRAPARHTRQGCSGPSRSTVR